MAKAPHTPAPPAAPPSEPVAAASKFKFAVESNIPMPDRRAGREANTYPFPILEPTQSFFVPATEKMPEPWKTLTSLTSRMTRSMHPKVFSSVRTKEKGVEGVRVWRDADTDKPLAEPRKNKVRTPKEGEGSKAALEKEAIEGDTSNKVKHHEPDFEGAGAPDNPPPPPPPPAAA